jgi:hypothetical protein
VHTLMKTSVYSIVLQQGQGEEAPQQHDERDREVGGGSVDG